MLRKLQIQKAALLLLASASGLFAQNDSLQLRYGKLISSANMSRDLHVLASDEYEGRETGQQGQKLAASYIAGQFRAAGIPPYKDTTYFQQYPLSLVKPRPASISANGKEYRGNVDYYNFPGQSDQQIAVNSILFLGYGIEEANYNDYKSQEVKNHILVVLAAEPLMNDTTSLITGTKKKSAWTTYYKLKIEKARERGAAALFIVTDNLEKAMQENSHKLNSPSLKLSQGAGQTADMPVIYISADMAKELLHRDIAKLRKTIRSSQKPVAFTAKCKLKLSISNDGEQISAENVLGYVEGTDLKNELLVITAHYDHLGKEGTVVYNGADDDGSGTVAVIELARVFAKAKAEGHGPRRSILFMTVSGEEKGLLGSSYYAENPVFPLSSTIADLNIDMIGRLDEKHAGNPDYVYVIGSDKLSSTLHRINEEANTRYTRLQLDYTFNDENDRNRFYYRSDHYNFARKGIPVIFYFNGVHADYHKETDEVEKIDFNKMQKIASLVFHTAWELANRNERIAVDSNKR